MSELQEIIDFSFICSEIENTENLAWLRNRKSFESICLYENIYLVFSQLNLRQRFIFSSVQLSHDFFEHLLFFLAMNNFNLNWKNGRIFFLNVKM